MSKKEKYRISYDVYWDELEIKYLGTKKKIINGLCGPLRFNGRKIESRVETDWGNKVEKIKMQNFSEYGDSFLNFIFDRLGSKFPITLRYKLSSEFPTMLRFNN